MKILILMIRSKLCCLRSLDMDNLELDEPPLRHNFGNLRTNEPSNHQIKIEILHFDGHLNIEDFCELAV